MSTGTHKERMFKDQKIPEMLFSTLAKQTKSILPVSADPFHRAQEQDHHETLC